jgi:hypothetical protein
MAHRSSSKTKAELEAEVAELRAELKALSKQNKRTLPRQFPWRSLGVWVCTTLAVALLVLGNILFWAGNTIVNTDRYVKTVGPVIEQPAVQSAVADYTTNAIFNTVDVQSYVQSALPERAEFLAPQLTNQLKSQTDSRLQSLLANPKVQDLWYSSLQTRHEALIDFSKSYEGNGEIVVSDIYSQLSKRLSDSPLSFLAGKQLPDSVGSIKVATAGWLPVLHNLANNMGLYQTLATIFFLIFASLAVVLARRPRRSVIRLTALFAIFLFITLIATRIGKTVVMAQIDPTYKEAAGVAYSTVLHSFVLQTVSLLIFSMLVMLVAWISGPYRSAHLVKDRIIDLLSGRLHETFFGTKENGFTTWLGAHKRVVQWLVVAIVFLLVLLATLTPKLLIGSAIGLVILILIIEVLAAPQAKTTRRT